MKTKTTLLLFIISLPNLAVAGGAATGGATEWTQILNNIQLANSFAQQVQQYTTQLQQYQNQLQNMALNPASVLPSDISRLASGLGGIMEAGQGMDSTMAGIDSRFASAYKNPTALSYSANFKNISESTNDTLKGAMKAAGLQLDSQASTTSALQALYNKSQQSQGTVAAIQTLSEINAQQIVETQKLQSALATQSIAEASFMAGQSAKDQDKHDAQQALIVPSTKPIPMIGSGKLIDFLPNRN